MSESEKAKTLFFEALEFIDSSHFQIAESRLRDALQLSPNNAAILTNLSLALLRQNKCIEARACAEKAISIGADNIEALLVLADCYIHAANFTEAIVAYDKIISLDPAIAEAHNNRGIVLENLGRFSDALLSYDRAIALEPGSSDVYTNRGNALKYLKRYDEALAA